MEADCFDKYLYLYHRRKSRLIGYFEYVFILINERLVRTSFPF